MPSHAQVFAFAVGALTAAFLLPLALVALWPASRKVKILPAPRRSDFHRADAAAWLEKEGFSRRCAVRHGPRLFGPRPLEVFHQAQRGTYAFLGDGPTGRPSLRLISRCADGHLVDTVASGADGEPAEPSHEDAWAHHRRDLDAAAAAHGAAILQADSEIARQMAALAQWGASSIPELRSRMVIGQVLLWMGLGGVVLALSSGWPLALFDGAAHLGFRAIFVLALTSNAAFELWFWRPWHPKVRVVASKASRVPGTSAVRLELESAGFSLLGQKAERSRRASLCDVYAHDGERAWANLTADRVRGIHGYFLSTFANGASVITWTCQTSEKQGMLTVGWASGFAQAWERHRATVSRLSDTHGALERCQTAEDREKATLAYYRAGGA